MNMADLKQTFDMLRDQAISVFFETLKAREGCVHCMRAIEHATKHGKDDTYVSCVAHRFVNVCKSRFSEFENPANNGMIKTTEHVVIMDSVDEFEILAAYRGVEVTTRNGETASLFPVVAAVIERGEYVHRHHAVLVEKLAPIDAEGDVTREWVTLLHDVDSVNAVAFATALAGARAVDTCVHGEARESNTFFMEFSQRNSCPACSVFEPLADAPSDPADEPVELRDIADQLGLSIIRAGNEEYLIVYSSADRDAARSALDTAGFKDTLTLLVLHDIWHDGAFHGDKTAYRVVETSNGDEFVLVTSNNSEDGLYDANPVDFLMGRAEDWVNCTHHPSRVARALIDLNADVEKIDDEYENDGRGRALPGEEFWLVVNEGDKPNFTALVFKADCKHVSSRDCSQGTDDHDRVYKIVAGPYKDKYLRDYASRCEGSADYEATLLEASLPEWATE
jgi:hypothetical protein